ncbi:Rieske (2Fe-2S) protein [Paenibacillus hemerocallicola]|uniref:Rieske (2Fe-2S) protein n=1 Tax=Paenibacillus hemerocallicola TaxID=1172614 RepID=A0A5C4T6M2_9BACL|nr:Rieske (2Fe-2S) protein [Paenibacillus hemerocallicola]TNJ63977.1 Rieske (2Fe-2S) protein [Paenibacillus hemerocallicola]
MSEQPTTSRPADRKYAVAKAADIAPGTRKIVHAGDRSIGVYNIAGKFYAIRNVCPHQGAPLCRGLTTALVVSDEPGGFRHEREGEIVRCPWHQWEFDIKTGQMIVDPKMRTKTYEVTVETFDVTVVDEMVVVHM